MITQQMVSHPAPLPACKAGHAARHIHDCRRASAGGGHQVECACSHTSKHAEFDDALREWCVTHGRPVPAIAAPKRSSVTHLRATK